MKTYPVATILWAVIKSMDIIIRLIQSEKYDLAIERCERTKAAIKTCLGCDKDEVIDSI